MVLLGKIKIKEFKVKNNSKKKILVLCFSDLSRDPRVYRQIIALKDEYQVIAAGFKDPLVEDADFVRLADIVNRNLLDRLFKLIKIKLHLYVSYYWSKWTIIAAYNKLKSVDFDLILANDLDALPLAVRLSQEKNAKLIYDAHEYSPREFENSFRWRLLWQRYKAYLCKAYLPMAHATITVCDGIAKEYNKNFGVDAIVITNAPFYNDLLPQDVAKDQIKIIHHGGAMPGRKLELMIDLMSKLDGRFTLDLMLVYDDRKYFDFLKQKAAHNNKIKFVDPVAMPEIAAKINNYDIGVFILKGVNFNWEMALPNKLFEFIQARLMVAIGPSVEMAKYVNKYNLGIVAPDFSPEIMAKMLNALTSEQILAFKNNSHKAAYELSADTNKEKLLAIVKNTLMDHK